MIRPALPVFRPLNVAANIEVVDQNTLSYAFLHEEWLEISCDSGTFRINRHFGGAPVAIVYTPEDHPNLKGRSFRFDFEAALMAIVAALDDRQDEAEVPDDAKP